jgi:uncharacterized protein involved in exopolysaccharide biosynthesis
MLLLLVQVYNSELSKSPAPFANPSSDGSATSAEPSPQQYFVQNNEAGGMPVQINIDSANLTTASSADALESLDQILRSINEQKSWIENRLTELESEILTLQRDVQIFHNEQARLVQEQTVARDTVLSLSQKVQEVNLALGYAKSAGPVEVVGEAVTPDKPISRNTVRNASMAAIAGLILGVLGIFLKNWWLESEPLRKQEPIQEHSF